MELNEDLLRLQHDGRHLRLTVKQFRMVRALYRSKRILERSALMDAVDPFLESEADHRSLDSEVKRIRRGMRTVWGMDDWIKTVSGMGYYWDHEFPENGERRGWRTWRHYESGEMKPRPRKKPHQPE